MPPKKSHKPLSGQRNLLNMFAAAASASAAPSQAAVVVDEAERLFTEEELRDLILQLSIQTLGDIPSQLSRFIKSPYKKVVPENCEFEARHLANRDIVTGMKFEGGVRIRYLEGVLTLDPSITPLPIVFELFATTPELRAIFQKKNHSLFLMDRFIKLLEACSYPVEAFDFVPLIAPPVKISAHTKNFPQGVKIFAIEKLMDEPLRGQALSMQEQLGVQEKTVFLHLHPEVTSLAEALAFFLKHPELRQAFSQPLEPSKKTKGQYFIMKDFFQFMSSLGYDTKHLFETTLVTAPYVDWRSVDLMGVTLQGESAECNLFVDKPPRAKKHENAERMLAEHHQKEALRIYGLNLERCVLGLSRLTNMRWYLQTGHVHLPISALQEGAANLKSGSLQGSVQFSVKEPCESVYQQKKAEKGEGEDDERLLALALAAEQDVDKPLPPEVIDLTKEEENITSQNCGKLAYRKRSLSLSLPLASPMSGLFSPESVHSPLETPGSVLVHEPPLKRTKRNGLEGRDASPSPEHILQEATSYNSPHRKKVERRLYTLDSEEGENAREPGPSTSGVFSFKSPAPQSCLVSPVSLPFE